MHRDRISGAVWMGYDARRDGDSFEVPCGKCVGCRLDKAREWAVRITHEAQLYRTNWMATLTYRDEDLPLSRSLEYRDFQLFMKRLRKRVGGEVVGPQGGRPLRFFCSGEYGYWGKRPHFHAILFNCRFGDERPFGTRSFWSGKCEELWLKGAVQLDAVTATSAAYVAGYTQKKVYGASAADAYEDVCDLSTGEVSSRRREFAAMSLKPGLGAWWYQKYGADLFPQDYAVMERGKKYKVPRYYWKKKQLEDPEESEEIAYARFLRAQEQLSESSPERRAVREEVALRKLEFWSERKNDCQ